jgi:hypothetical protein
MQAFDLWMRGQGVDLRTIRLLRSMDTERQRIAAAGDVAGSGTWLLRFRRELRWAIHKGHLPTIKHYVRVGPAEMAPIAIWLWGRCTDRFRLYGLSSYCNNQSPQVRKQVAKALRRVEAWSRLNEMAAAHPDDAKVQWFAKTPITRRRPFAERLSSFVQSVDDSHADEVVTPSSMPFWAVEHTWDYTPPKSVQLIRRMLRRIRHWVRWGVGEM